MTPLQKVELITRPLPMYEHGLPVEPVDAEQVIGVRVGGQQLDLPMDSRIAVEYEAGGGTATVTLTILAGTVRHVPEGDL